MFDQYACWADGMPNTTVKVPCPWYLPWYDQVKNGFVLRECGADGQWATSKTSLTWRDHSQCDTSISQQTAQALAGCRVAQILMQYCVGANYCWLLVEGVYLHNLLVLMVFSERSHFHGYIIIGWGTPVLFVVPWTVARYLYENISSSAPGNVLELLTPVS
ncbi:hypothetical protein Z043_118428 [Scleropages formosus]|uniref:Gastric inhibitory polypeptide receptor-like n=1 Tax=Scleropages formosus TaxID=113540 RepID=A0A0P7YAZ7_SCLFO|nr:hypothetical protein Z043_118428 [Scleropages formosus]